MPKRKHPSKRDFAKRGKFSNQIVEYLVKNPNKPMNYKQIAAGLNLMSGNERELLVKDLAALAKTEVISEEGQGKYKINIGKYQHTGIIDFTHTGTAYVSVDGFDEDVQIPKNHTKNALQGDLVSIIVLPNQKKGHRIEGEVITVIKRFKKLFTGIFEKQENGKFGFVSTDNRSMHVDFYIPKVRFNNAENGQKVIVELKDWPEGSDSPFGEIVEILGDPESTDAEMNSILVDNGLPLDFPADVKREAEEMDVEIKEEEIKNRRDMRQTCTFTIDPKDAKDFDDALSFKKLENGNYEVGVHIADVTHYVQPGSLLDNEAYQRGNTIYMVDRTIPMLPEKLSNLACSLRPNEEKYTFSAVFEMDDNAQIVSEWFGRTVIYSDRRFTYQEAQEVIETGKGDYSEEIQILDRLAKILRKKRMSDGAITFDKVEVKFELDDKLNPIGTYVNVMGDSNHLIEEFMLLSNRKVSEFVSLKSDGKVSGNTFVYRVHENPDPDKLQDLRLFIKQFGYTLDLSNHKTITHSMNQLLADVKGKPEENLIETLAVRTMSKAKYSTENNIGHYGLAFRFYSHFTSPIRRYADVMAHRLLQHYLDGKKSPAAAVYEEKCVHCSQTEKQATDAERDSVKFMQVKYMSQFIGEEFYGYISGVQEFGFFVEIPETHCEGLVRLRNLSQDDFHFDQKNYSVVGRRTGIIYQLGDKVMVKVARADLKNKQLDFELLG